MKALSGSVWRLSVVLVCAGCASEQPDPAQATSTAGSMPVAMVTAGTAAGPAGRGGTGPSSAGSRSVGTAGKAAAGAAGPMTAAVAGQAAAGSGGAGMMAAVTGGTGGGGGGAMAAAGSGAAGSTSASGGKGGDGAAGKPSASGGMCCSGGSCLCHGEPATDLGYKVGPYDTDSYALALTGTVYYPTDAEPPLAGIAIIPGFLNSGPEMADWGPFYASYGIVVVVTNTDPSAPPSSRATTLLNGVKALKAENTESGSPLYGKLSDRFGTSGYSMGGGGTTIASGQDSSLKVSIGLAPWGGNGDNVTVATLLLCGSADTTAPCSMSSPVYRAISDSTPKMMVVMQGASHFAWFGPEGAEFGRSGMIALAFAKLHLEGDERWKSVLLMADGMTNIQ